MSELTDLIAVLRKKTGPILLEDIVNLLKADAEETAAALSAKQSAVLAPGVRGPGTISQSLVVAVLDLGTPITAWGADPTGIADSTAAIQAALNTLDDSKSIRIPHGKYRISASLQIPNKKGWSITTEGRPQIIQYTDNIPIFVTPDSTETSPAHFSVGELSLAYANIQSVANTNAICIKVGTAGFYEASFGRLAFINCFRGISSASGLVWGCLFNHLFYDASCTGSMLYLAGIAGQPTNVINKGFSRGHNLSEPLMNFNTARIRINSFETNEHYTGQSFIRATSSYVSCGLLVFEEGTFADQAALFDISTSRFAADIIEVQNFRINAPTGNQSAGIFKDTGGSGSRIKGGIVHITGTSIIAGTPVFIIAAGGLTSAEYIFDAWDWDNDGWRSTDGFSVGARTRMRVLGWEVGNYQQNAASTSLDANSPKLWRWIGDLSQNVIMVAPYKRLVSNLEFVFIIEATTTGGGSVIIRNSDGSTELATLSAGTRRVCKIGHNGSINNGWYVSN